MAKSGLVGRRALRGGSVPTSGVWAATCSSGHSMSRRRCATAAASVRLVTPSFAMMRETCTLAVLGDIASSCAIW